MTPEQKIRWAVVKTVYGWKGKEVPPFPCDNIDDLYSELEETDEHWDGLSEVRCSGIETGLPCKDSRHYESKSVATGFPDGSWVGWTYWYGGGKHGEPEAIDWISEAYHVECKEEEKLVVVREFKKAA